MTAKGASLIIILIINGELASCDNQVERDRFSWRYRWDVAR